MNYRTALGAFVFTSLFSVLAAAEDEARSPGDMSPQERMTMMTTASKYDNCVYSHAISKVGDFPDIRQSADFAMTECQEKIDDLEKSITDMGFGADFANAFSKRIKRRAARKILPELAVRKAGG